MSRPLVALTAFVLCGAPLRAQESQRTPSFPEYHLTLDLPFEEPLLYPPAGGWVKGSWSQQLGDSTEQEASWDELMERVLNEEITDEEAHDLYWAKFPLVTISFKVMNARKYLYNEPGDVAHWMIKHKRDSDEAFSPERVSFSRGPFGYAPFGAYFEGDTHGKDGGITGRNLSMCGLLEEDGYLLEVRFPRSTPSDEDLKPYRDFLMKGVRYDGPERDPNWSDEEIIARWKRDAPDDLAEDFIKAMQRPGTKKKVVSRTKNYILLTNSFSGVAFSKNLKANYKEIKETFPFKDVEGMRLMPVFLFRTNEQYIQFCIKGGQSREEATSSGGHAWKDYYVTWYEAPKDPVHIHECTHQLFMNRLHLNGGGSWFQEGVAEYMGSTKTERNEAARLIKKGKHTSLREFIKIESLLHSSEEDVRGGSESSIHYKQAALFIEFLREGKFGKAGFDSFLTMVGNLPSNDVPKIEAAFQELYGSSIEEIDEEWQKYCKKER